MLTLIFEPSAPDTPRPLTATEPCAMAYTCPSAPFSGDSSRLPPRRLLALPSEDTVTSMVCPARANGGSVPCTTTAATFFSCGFTFCGTTTPNCASMLRMLWMVNGVWLVWSPVPSRPTTRP
jgi:hypothetical protein